jgi:hypothetical protein
LRGGAIDFSAVVISELELHGYAIERVYEHRRLIGVCLLDSGAPIHPPYAGATDGADFALASGQATRRKPPVRPHAPLAIQANQDLRSLVARPARRLHGRQKRCTCPLAPHH